jgi:hypothetical protein
MSDPACFIVYSIDSEAVTIIGVFSTHDAAFQCCERTERAGNKNVWMVLRSMDKNSHPHRIEFSNEDGRGSCTSSR